MNRILGTLLIIIDTPSDKRNRKRCSSLMCCLLRANADDEPADGPQHYVVISGFYQPHLLTYLDEVGIAVDCIIQVESTIPASQLPAAGKQALCQVVVV